MMTTNINYYNKDDYYKINNTYNIYYPIGDTCEQFHTIFYEDSKEKDITKKDNINKLISYIIPSEMSFFYRNRIGYNGNILLDFFNGIYIEKMLSNKFISYQEKIEKYGGIINKGVNDYISHIFGFPFPIKYYTKEKYIRFRYKYFTDNRYRFFYTIDLITGNFSKITPEYLYQFEDYLSLNNFNLQNFVYIYTEKNLSKFKDLKIPYILLPDRSYNHLTSPVVYKCPGTICTICRENSTSLKYILENIMRIENENITNNI